MAVCDVIHMWYCIDSALLYILHRHTRHTSSPALPAYILYIYYDTAVLTTGKAGVCVCVVIQIIGNIINLNII